MRNLNFRAMSFVTGLILAAACGTQAISADEGQIPLEGQSCLKEFQVNSFTDDDQMYPSIAMGPNGNFIVTWISKIQDNGGRGVYCQRFSADGNRIGSEFKISTDPVDGHKWSPSIGIDENGNFVVVFVGFYNGERSILARRYNSEGASIGDQFRVNTDTDSAGYPYNSHTDPCIAVNKSGAFVVVWHGFHGIDDHNGEGYLRARVYQSNGLPLSDQFTVSDDGREVQVAMDDIGDFVVTWSNLHSSVAGYQVATRRYNADGTPKANVVYLDENIANPTPRIAMSGNGNYIIAWQSHPETYRENDIYIQRFDSNGNSISGPSMANTNTEGQQGQASVAMNDDGEFVVVWSNRTGDGSEDGVFGQKYDNTGAPVGGEFRINTFVYGMQWFPEPAIRSDGEYVTVWQSVRQDGSGEGIFGQIGPRPDVNCFCNCSDADVFPDEHIDLKDFALLANNWLEWGVGLEGDITANGSVDPEDLQALLSQWLGFCDESPGILFQEISDCLTEKTEKDGELRFSATVHGTGIYFEDLMVANCCSDKLELKMTVEGDIIKIHETEHSPNPCYCICNYPVKATLGPFAPGVYKLQVHEDHGGLIGSTIVVIVE